VLGGVRLEGGSGASSQFATLPGGSIVIPPGCKTEWRRPGTIDFATFVFPEHPTGIQEKIQAFATARGTALSLSDPLVAAATLHIVNELQKGPSRDDAYVSKLSLLMLEQIHRTLTAARTKTFNARHTHHARLQAALDYIQKNLGNSLSAKSLAARAGVSEMYFRHLFKEAVGLSVHRYVMMARLELARKLLTTTNTPIASIALTCGFSSQSHLTSSFRTTHAATPAEFRAQFTQR
jgi:AraC family transcriptional regulator